MFERVAFEKGISAHDVRLFVCSPEMQRISSLISFRDSVAAVAAEHKADAAMVALLAEEDAAMKPKRKSRKKAKRAAAADLTVNRQCSSVENSRLIASKQLNQPNAKERAEIVEAERAKKQRVRELEQAAAKAKQRDAELKAEAAMIALLAEEEAEKAQQVKDKQSKLSKPGAKLSKAEARKEKAQKAQREANGKLSNSGDQKKPPPRVLNDGQKGSQKRRKDKSKGSKKQQNGDPDLKDALTAELDRLAEEEMRFTNGHTTEAHSAPRPMTSGSSTMVHSWSSPLAAEQLAALWAQQLGLHKKSLQQLPAAAEAAASELWLWVTQEEGLSETMLNELKFEDLILFGQQHGGRLMGETEATSGFTIVSGPQSELVTGESLVVPTVVFGELTILSEAKLDFDGKTVYRASMGDRDAMLVVLQNCKCCVQVSSLQALHLPVGLTIAVALTGGGVGTAVTTSWAECRDWGVRGSGRG